MTVDDVRKILEEIYDTAKKDPEGAHGTEDRLWAEVLEAIATGAENPRELAQEALKSRDIEFPRWYG